MSAHNETQKNETGRILTFPARFPFARRKAGLQATGENAEHNRSAVSDLRRYEQGQDEPDDFPQRMKINAVAFVFIVMLTMAGVWLADQLALTRKQSDCVLTGRKNCMDIETPLRDR